MAQGHHACPRLSLNQNKAVTGTASGSVHREERGQRRERCLLGGATARGTPEAEGGPDSDKNLWKQLKCPSGGVINELWYIVQ